ncbi:hypothetical protein KL86SPO_20273 [uncultured Sporomusa sp.]|uniref:Uncharacterized protein n=1 Tax=uncultured Sporomusa sp. TaxID=307249 RepID=A0A212LMU9_9FIRM|nr:hypothetical protein KL86SPO_20273 [uncultured Sporomusa sp.]
MVEQSAVNRSVVGSSPTRGAIYRGMEQLVARRAHNPKVVGSSPTPATNYGGCGEVVNTPDCGSGIRGFDPLQSPHIGM